MTDRRKAAGPRALRLLLALATLTLGCEFFTPGKNALGGTGPRAMDPYLGRPSGAIRLALQLYNGCGVLADGANTGMGSPRFGYPYPANCTDVSLVTRPASANRPMPVVAGVPYFLDEFSITEVVFGLHTDPKNVAAPLAWLKTQSAFKGLDWNNTGVTNDEWEGDRNRIGASNREVTYGNAVWMASTNDSFLVEILDPDGVPVASQTYPRSSLAITNPIGGHTMFNWGYGPVASPEFLGDTRVLPIPPQPTGGAMIPQVRFRTMARLDLVAQTDPHARTLTIPQDLRGDGAARVTWSLLPDNPFFFPLTFTHPDDPGFPQCWDATDPQKRVPCDFGVNPQITFTTPANGEYYQPGETFQMIAKITDGLGNLLHPHDSFFSFDDALLGKANGLLYGTPNAGNNLGERSSRTSMSVQGPVQLMRPNWGATEKWFSQFGRGALPNFASNGNTDQGSRGLKGETRWPVRLPANANPGTYVGILKANRQFMGERVARTNLFYFQVGQKAVTLFPQRVGNCQICHRGAVSLDNLAGGLGVAGAEACKSCHTEAFNTAPPDRFIHQIHNGSPRYPAKKNDCSVCHLTRESAMRPSLLVCTACHLQAHAGQYFSQSLLTPGTSGEPNIGSSCASDCHAASTPPTQHIYTDK